jgi:cysteine desulfurase
MYGPKGIGALFIRRELQQRIEPMIYGGGQQRELRSGTVPVALCVGMGAAAALFDSEQAKEDREVLRAQRDKLVRGLMSLSWPIRLNGPESVYRHPGNTNICFTDFAANDILNALQPHLAASTGAACTSGIPEPSHVLKAIGLSACEAEASIRFSIGRGTTDRDVDNAINLISDTLSRLARAGLVRSA